ncbi:hypothetical protein Q5424_07960 [Conexibacter sp. JD483]|uniref:hypothetical protein n=1 Tax=unclassified Conexibacter TaxID=2627773 RepID=UPI00271B9F19|nr:MULTISPECIES: hypothetical protein [unclassified Conexibacter]MDO8184750.1 hypothetical protein [Conexibacter sp. CPCC 205706]MDO8196525.1 hypothetical protein [Conexibacter sp. CPCC 205762]MDR9369011.1 hypothetical protein [Conexibacter sp. JD483]
MARVARDALVRSWTRAQEDDSEGCLVYRPSDADLPPARAPRSGLELGADGALRELTPGPADKREATGGSWELDGEQLTLRVEGGPSRRYGVERADEHELRLRELG